MPDRSVASRMTSEAMPESSHDLAVIIPALALAHMAETDIVGPWKSNSFITMVKQVEGIMFTHILGRIRLSPDR